MIICNKLANIIDCLGKNIRLEPLPQEEAKVLLTRQYDLQENGETNIFDGGTIPAYFADMLMRRYDLAKVGHEPVGFGWWYEEGDSILVPVLVNQEWLEENLLIDFAAGGNNNEPYLYEHDLPEQADICWFLVHRGEEQ